MQASSYCCEIVRVRTKVFKYQLRGTDAHLVLQFYCYMPYMHRLLV